MVISNRQLLNTDTRHTLVFCHLGQKAERSFHFHWDPANRITVREVEATLSFDSLSVRKQALVDRVAVCIP